RMTTRRRGRYNRRAEIVGKRARLQGPEKSSRNPPCGLGAAAGTSGKRFGGIAGPAACCARSTRGVDPPQRLLGLGRCGGDGRGQAGRVLAFEFEGEALEVAVEVVAESIEELLELVPVEAGQGILESALGGGPVHQGSANASETVQAERGLQACLLGPERIGGWFRKARHPFIGRACLGLIEPGALGLGVVLGHGTQTLGGSEIGKGGREGLDAGPLKADGQPLAGGAVL